MTVSRRSFLTGATAGVALISVGVGDRLLPRVIPPSREALRTCAFTLGLLGLDGRELTAPDYQRKPLFPRDCKDGYELLLQDSVFFPTSPWTVKDVAVYSLGWNRPIKIVETLGMPITISLPGSTLTVAFRDGVALRIFP